MSTKKVARLQSTVVLCSLSSLLLVAIAGKASSAHLSVTCSDSFEGSALDAFWSPIRESSGSISLSDTVAHAGTQSVKLDSTRTDETKVIALFHYFDRPMYGTASVWVYDTGAGISSSNAFGFNLLSDDRTIAQWGTWDYDFGREEDNYWTHYEIGPSGEEETSYVPFGRTEGWHQWTIESNPSGVTFSIDGNAFQTVPGLDLPFTRVTISMGAPDWRPPYTVYFDDFEIHAWSAPLLPGDLNEDGLVNSGDLDIVRACWGAQVETGRTDCGDVSGDGLVDSRDLDLVRANWRAATAANVPEPGLALAACVGAFSLVLRRGRS